MTLAKIAAALQRLVRLGYPRDAALLAVTAAWALSPEQVVLVDQLTRE